MGFIPGGDCFGQAGMIAFAGKIGLESGFIPET
jgi:hypothetical protein